MENNLKRIPPASAVGVVKLDTRDLQERREELEAQVLESFLEEFPQYEDMTIEYDDIRFEEEEIESWKEVWVNEIAEIAEIESLADEVGPEWNYGVTLIPCDDFEDYCIELVGAIGEIPRELPSYISNNIDWEGVADDLRVDYTELTYKDETYLFRA
jgi:antirestriction protein